MRKGWLIVGLITGVLLVILAPGWAEEHPQAALALAVGGGALGVFVVLILGAALGGTWTARTMERGAGIALRAQQVNDQWDAKKTAAMANVFRAGVVLRSRYNNPALPAGEAVLPFGDGLWAETDVELPPLEEPSGRYLITDAPAPEQDPPEVLDAR